MEENCRVDNGYMIKGSSGRIRANLSIIRDHLRYFWLPLAHLVTLYDLDLALPVFTLFSSCFEHCTQLLFITFTLSTSFPFSKDHFTVQRGKGSRTSRFKDIDSENWLFLSPGSIEKEMLPSNCWLPFILSEFLHEFNTFSTDWNKEKCDY